MYYKLVTFQEDKLVVAVFHIG